MSVRPRGIITCPQCERHTLFNIEEINEFTLLKEGLHKKILGYHFSCTRCDFDCLVLNRRYPQAGEDLEPTMTQKEMEQVLGWSGPVPKWCPWYRVSIGVNDKAVNPQGNHPPPNTEYPRPPEWLRRWRIH